MLFPCSDREAGTSSPSRPLGGERFVHKEKVCMPQGLAYSWSRGFLIQKMRIRKTMHTVQITGSVRQAQR